MTADLKTATSAIPSVLFTGQLAAGADAVLYAAPVGSTTLGILALTNVTGTAATALVSLVKSGGTGAAGNRIIARTLAPGESVYLDVTLGEGDFLSGQSATGTAVTAVLHGSVFSNSAGATLTGIRDDAIGSGGYSSTSPVTGTHMIGNGGNRYLLAALGVCQTSNVAWSSYTALGMTCADGAMTRLVSVDFGSTYGSVHLFGRANPSNVSHTLTGTVTGPSLDHVMLSSMSLTGVASVSGAVSADRVSSPSAMGLSVTSALGHRVVFAAVGQDMAQSLNRRYRGFQNNGATGYPTGVAARFMWLADGDGAGTVAITSTNSFQHSVVGIDLVPA